MPAWCGATILFSSVLATPIAAGLLASAMVGGVALVGQWLWEQWR